MSFLRFSTTFEYEYRFTEYRFAAYEYDAGARKLRDYLREAFSQIPSG